MSADATSSRRLLAGAAALLLLTGTAGCNTMAGMGEDIESAGAGLEHEAEETQEEM